MGIDCVIGFVPREALTPKQIANLQGRLREAMGCHDELRVATSHNRLGFSCEVVNSWRYYGLGYERGPWVQIRAVLAWLLANIDGDVYYCGDCDDYRPPTIDAALVAEIDTHWAKHGSIPYRSHGDRAVMCPTCDIPTAVVSWGPDGTGHSCGGCEWLTTIANEGTADTAAKEG